VTEALLDRVVKVRQINLINLLLERPVVCELLRGECTPERIATEAALLVQDERVRAMHVAGYDEAMHRLEAGGRSPSLRAADQVLAIVAARRCGGPASSAPSGGRI
jgi:lipid-A-disaccharide synthase